MAKAKNNTARKADWTVMVYLAGDNNLDGAGVVDLGEMKRVGSSERLSLIAQFDRSGAKLETKRYYLQKAPRKDTVTKLGETNMGDPKVLRDFLAWGAKNYPARHYMVVIWNHGAGWDDENIYRAVRGQLKRNVTYKRNPIGAPVRGASGAVPLTNVRAAAKRPVRRALFSTTVLQTVQKRAIAFDDNAQDFLDNIELKRVLTEARGAFGGKIDVLGMDACLMNMVEVAYQVRNTAQVMVGSQEVEPGDGWPYDTILRELAKNPTMTPEELGNAVVTRYIASYGASEDVTQSALDLGRSTGIETAIDGLAKAVLQGLPADPTRLPMLQARQAVQDFYRRDYIDLVHFCELLRSFGAPAPVRTACEHVETAAKAFVIAKGQKGTGLAHSNGISIYFPAKTISPLYSKLDFARNNKWNEMLQAYLDAVNMERASVRVAGA